MNIPAYVDGVRDYRVEGRCLPNLGDILGPILCGCLADWDDLGEIVVPIRSGPNVNERKPPEMTNTSLNSLKLSVWCGNPKYGIIEFLCLFSML
jgi:hypothetical protein